MDDKSEGRKSIELLDMEGFRKLPLAEDRNSFFVPVAAILHVGWRRKEVRSSTSEDEESAVLQSFRACETMVVTTPKSSFTSKPKFGREAIPSIIETMKISQNCCSNNIRGVHG